ncbi:diacylglycerol kinase family protein [Fervidobacterium thailandense]|uniref:Diacylglycerol kinase n=1 Tax=Fervidobacterium thailandense TaxID=1008305 RepID=A0A1E3G0D0_9BACT|nr:diacylglycerol kinase family protein [Fervidobacterium thailandense]ODN29701.1 diacylglycerol kinase [Fervidobacterium thailandense]
MNNLGSPNLAESFSHAIDGIVESILSERNLRIHFAIGLIILATTFFLPIPREDLLWVVFAVFFVIWSELVNTIIEHLMNLYSSEFHPVIKIIKDVSAGVVLWASLFAVTVGIIVFGGLLFNWSLEVGKVFAIISTAAFPLLSFKVVRSWKTKR